MPNKFVQVLTFFGFVCGCPACFGQSMMSAAHGTLVIIVADKDRIVAGADSLTTGVTVDGTDTSCKLMPLSKEMFFAATNKTAVSHVDSGKRVFFYDAHQFAKGSFSRFRSQKNTDTRVNRIATDRGDSVSKKMNEYLIAYPPERVGDRLTLVQGIFAASTKAVGGPSI